MHNARARATVPIGDDIGAACFARSVGESLRERRKARGLSLDGLAQASGVSRAALSQIETGRTNPTVGVLWKVAVGLGIPFGDLLGAPRSRVSVLRRADVRPLRSADGRFESRPLAPAGTSPFVEMYELRLAARAVHQAEAHAEGTWELLVVLSGRLRLRTQAESFDLGPGDSIAFDADRPHAYENPWATQARYHDLIAYKR